MVLGAIALLASLFLPWSHQLSGAVRAQYGASAALQGVPTNPTAWQVYSAVDVVLALLAGALLAAALRGGRGVRLALMAALAIAAAFTLHALSVPPTNGATLFDPTLTPPGYTPDPAGRGAGGDAGPGGARSRARRIGAVVHRRLRGAHPDLLSNTRCPSIPPTGVVSFPTSPACTCSATSAAR